VLPAPVLYHHDHTFETNGMHPVNDDQKLAASMQTKQ
jgi:hypothetical protein